jgi:hypothetical protein
MAALPPEDQEPVEPVWARAQPLLAEPLAVLPEEAPLLPVPGSTLVVVLPQQAVLLIAVRVRQPVLVLVPESPAPEWLPEGAAQVAALELEVGVPRLVVVCR